MAFVLKFFKTVRTHWKKSIFFTGVSIYGIKFAKEKYEDDLLRREYCAKAKKYGEEILAVGEKSHRITVFLNPAADGGQGRKQFEKNAAPLLYLAGLEVNVVKTEYEGQVKQFLTVFDKKNTDGIVAAGGNETLLETVTGIMRKEDPKLCSNLETIYGKIPKRAKSFRRQIPLGVIPLGTTNCFARLWFGVEKTNIRYSMSDVLYFTLPPNLHMLDSAMAIIKGTTEKVDLLKIQTDDGKTVFAMCGLEAGEFRDAHSRIKKYWYMGPLKHRFTYLWSTVKSWPPVIRGSAEYVPVSEGEEKVKPKKKKVVVQEAAKSWSLLSFFRSPWTAPKESSVEEDDDDDDDDDDEMTPLAISTVELTINNNSLSDDKKRKVVEVGLGSSAPQKRDFINEGFRRLKEPSLKLGCENNEKLFVKRFKFTPEPPEGKQYWYNIDGENFEAMPIDVTLLKNRLKIFKNVNEDMQR